MAKITETPEIFLTRTNHVYPPGNNMVFEHYFLERFMSESSEIEREYLPIQWTCFYISRNYLQDSTEDLQNFLNSLPRDKKYFTVVQWDDGIKHNLDGLDVMSFASGGIGNYPIPLVNCPHTKEDKERDIFASFVGVIGGRHRVRERMRELLNDKDGYVIKERTGFDEFKDLMERSIFALCPRGYGRTSFRINEALNLGTIPVYIYDTPWIPFNDMVNFEDYGILIGEDNIENIDTILKSISPEKIQQLRENGKRIYEEFFKYESCYNKIIDVLKR
jgi:glycosyltransferase involved in cell wall biosynthesis